MNNNKIKTNEFFGLSTFQFLAYFRRLIVYTFLTIFLRNSLGLSNFEVTLMPTIGMLANAGTQSFVWGKLIDRLRNAKAFIVIGEFIAGLTHIGMVFIYQVFLVSDKRLAGYVIILTLGLTEIFWSMSNVGWSALISNLTVPVERKKIMARLSVIGGLGGIFGAQVGGLLYDSGAGFESGVIIYIAALVMIISSLLVLVLVHQHDYRPAKLSDGSSEPVMAKIKEKFSDLSSLTKKTYIWFMIALVLLNFGRNSIAVLTGIYLADGSSFGASDESIALFSNVSSIATIIIGVMIGTIIAKVDDNKVLLIGALTALLSIIWLILAPTFDQALISGFLIGASNVIIESSSYAITSKIIPEEFRGRLFGIYNATFFLSWGIAATLITGPTADYMITLGLTNANAYKVSFFVACLIVSLGIIVLLFSFKLVNEELAQSAEGSIQSISQL